MKMIDSAKTCICIPITAFDGLAYDAKTVVDFSN